MNVPSLRETLPAFARIGVLSFGGPAAQIALMHRELVEARPWLSEKRFLDALSFCMLLPGPEAMQLATYAGWRLHGVRGGLAAGLLFVLPGAALMVVLAALYLAYGDMPFVAALFLGVKAAVLAIVVEALLRVGRRTLAGREHWLIAGSAFVALFFLDLPYPLVVATAALWGFARAGPAEADVAVSVRLRDTARTVAIWLAVWLLPLGALALAAPDTVLDEIARFFSVLATLTFGGAYAVLAYMAQDAVEAYGWLSAREMVDGLGLAETTPGPLILVTAFVGFLAAARDGGGVLWGAAGALVTLWATFAPCFLWIFAGAPYIDWLQSRPRLRAALAAVTAAVVGVIANLSLWFALHVLFDRVEPRSLGPLRLWTPDPATLDWRATFVAAVAGVMLLALHQGLARVLALSALLGLALTAL